MTDSRSTWWATSPQGKLWSCQGGGVARVRPSSDLPGVPPRLIPPVAPKTELFATLVGNAFAIAVVGFAIAISLGKIFALRHGYRVDSNQVCAVGLCRGLVPADVYGPRQ